MSAATFKIELKQPARKDGTFAVRIRITRFRKHAYWNLGRYIEAGNLNKAPKERLKNWIIKHDDAPQINNAIDKALKGLATIADNNPAATAAGIKELYEKELNPVPEEAQPERGFFAYFKEYIARTVEINPATGIAYTSVYNKFLEYAGKKPDKELLAPASLHAFRTKALKDFAPSTVKRYFNVLGTIYRNGVMEGRIDQLGNPFKSIRLVVPEKILNRPTPEQIQTLISYQPKQRNRREAWLAIMLQYFLHGARISEALTLEWDKHVFPDKIVYLPAKNSARLKTVPRSPMLNWLLEQMPKGTRYVLPYLKEKEADLPPDKMYIRLVRLTVRINKALADIDKELKLNLGLTTHMMRRAFLDTVMDKTSDLISAQKMAGHSSSRTTEGYLQGPDEATLRKLSETVYEAFEIPGK